MKWLKRILFTVLILLFIVIIALWLYMKNDAKNPYEVPDPVSVEVPTFTEVDLGFSHQYNASQHLPVMGAGVIDVDGDGTPELWLGGGGGQQDALYRYDGEKFVDITEGSGFANKDEATQSYGPTVYDLDGDGDEDMLVCRDDGVYLYTNREGKFSFQKLDLSFDDKSTPLSVTCGDINGDGLIDLFVSAYLPKDKMEGQTIFMKKDYGANSLLFANRGNNRYEDITDTAGLRYTHNTFLGVFVDLDGDQQVDLAVAHDTGEPRIYKNLGGEKFQMMPNPLTGKYGYPMGIAVGDYNQDGRADLFYSNTGSTMPTMILKGDLDLDQHEFYGKWIMLRNEGNFKWTETGVETDVADFEFSWGAIFEDFNLDGRQDLSVAENYVALPLFKLAKAPCRFLLNTPGNKFVATGAASGVENRNYAISPITADFNDDGYPDLVYSNISGTSKAFISEGGDHNFLKVRLEQTAKALGAKVSVTQADGSVLTDWLTVAEGLTSDQSHTLVFGLGKSGTASSVTVDYTGGTTQTIDNPKVNSTLVINELTEEETLE